jgi:peptidoglycan/LPS O-acetylase OafA/YrhL
MAGLFVQRGVERESTFPYLRQRGFLFLYLYILWSVIQGVVKLITSNLVNSPVSLIDVLSIWFPDGQVWFLGFLIVMTIAVTLIKPWRSRTATLLSLAVALVVSLMSWGVFGTVIGTQGLGLTIFYFAGTVLTSRRFTSIAAKCPPTLAVVVFMTTASIFAALVYLTPLTPPTSFGVGRTLTTVMLGFVASVAGVIATLTLARLLSYLNVVVRWIAFLGERSLEIFLAHTVAVAGTRIILAWVGVDDALIQLAVGTAAGIGGPLALWFVLKSLGAPWLFDAPRFVTGPTASRPSR